jgi:hypothetical protein
VQNAQVFDMVIDMIDNMLWECQQKHRCATPAPRLKRKLSVPLQKSARILDAGCIQVSSCFFDSKDENQG